MKKRTKGKEWASKAPPERVALLRKLCASLREMADELGDSAAAGEVQALRLAARSVAGAGARVQQSIDLQHRPSCCLEARLFGSCRCGGA